MVMVIGTSPENHVAINESVGRLKNRTTLIFLGHTREKTSKNVMSGKLFIILLETAHLDSAVVNHILVHNSQSKVPVVT